jgi:hypothetical protein
MPEPITVFLGELEEPEETNVVVWSV